MNLWEEWQTRRVILNEALKILSDGKQHTGRDICNAINANGIQTDKNLVNSVLFSEGRRYVSYDRSNFIYCLKGDPFSILNATEEKEDDYNSIAIAGSVESKRHYVYDNSKQDSAAFFFIETRGGQTRIVLNKDHPFVCRLASLRVMQEASTPNLVKKLEMASECIRLMIQAWSDFESEQPEGRRKTIARDARIDWGRKLRNLLVEKTE